MAATLSSIGTRQAKATEQVAKETAWFLDYCHTHPNAGVQYFASDMILALESDASYQSEYDSKSRAGEHHLLTR